MDEKITANEWDKRKACPICRDIAEKKVNLDGEVMLHPKSGEPLPCPVCDYPETKMYHDIGGIESKRTSERGDTQIWNHLISVKCESCGWKHVMDNMVCLGDPWDEVFGFRRHLEQSDEQKHAITWTNEQAVGLRGAHDKYNKEAKLKGKGYRAHREITTEKTDGASKMEWIPTKEEKKLPKFRDKKEE